MKRIAFNEHSLSGSQLVIPFTPFESMGPKHYAIIVGACEDDGELWVAELSRRFGYRLVGLNKWLSDNRNYLDGLRIQPNRGNRTNWDVAQSAVDEVVQSHGNKLKYDVLFNNCETFAQRHETGQSSLSLQVQKAAKWCGVGMVAGMLVLRHFVRRNR